jgi:hypothetical protein
MKKQLILTVAILFTMALFAPAASYAFQAGTTPVVVVDNKEKKDDTKTTTQPEKKTDASATSESKACCNKAATGETKACCKNGEKSGCCKGSKAEVKATTGENKASSPTEKTDK